MIAKTKSNSMTFVKFNPRLRDQKSPFINYAYYGDIFNKFFPDHTPWSGIGSQSELLVNLSESADSYLIEVQAAGYSKEEFQIEVVEDKITISTKKIADNTSDSNANEARNYIRN